MAFEAVCIIATSRSDSFLRPTRSNEMNTDEGPNSDPATRLDGCGTPKMSGTAAGPPQRRRATDLHEQSTLRALTSVWLPFIALTYLLWSVPVRICFHPRYTPLDTRYYAYTALDYLADAFFLVEAWRTGRGHRISPVPADIQLFSTLSTPQPRRMSKLRQTLSSRLSRASTLVTRAGRITGAGPAAAHGGGGGGARPGGARAVFAALAYGIAANAPLELVAALCGAPRASVRLYLANRLLRAPQLPARLQALVELFEAAGVCRNIGLQRMWKLFFAMAMAGHWAGCGFYWIAVETVERCAAAHTGGAASGADDGGPVEARQRDCYTWAERDGLFELGADGQIVAERARSYALQRSVYWAYITMVTTGFGDIYPLTLHETLWCVLAMRTSALRGCS